MRLAIVHASSRSRVRINPPRRASEALGDYCAGPNHVLPTGRTARCSSPLGVYDFQKRTSMLRIDARTARFSSPLGVYDFQKRSSVLRISRAAARTLGPVAVTLAEGEGLVAHARSAAART
jgi:histidinol dehydrogenase